MSRHDELPGHLDVTGTSPWDQRCRKVDAVIKDQCAWASSNIRETMRALRIDDGSGTVGPDTLHSDSTPAMRHALAELEELARGEAIIPEGSEGITEHSHWLERCNKVAAFTSAQAERAVRRVRDLMRKLDVPEPRNLTENAAGNLRRLEALASPTASLPVTDNVAQDIASVLDDAITRIRSRTEGEMMKAKGLLHLLAEQSSSLRTGVTRWDEDMRVMARARLSDQVTARINAAVTKVKRDIDRSGLDIQPESILRAVEQLENVGREVRFASKDERVHRILLECMNALEPAAKAVASAIARTGLPDRFPRLQPTPIESYPKQLEHLVNGLTHALAEMANRKAGEV